MNKQFHKLFAVLFLVFLFLSAPKTFAATLNLILDKGTAQIGEQFSGSVRIDSEDTGINAAQADLQFTKDVVEIVEVDKANSIFNFWLEEPSFSNETGHLNFIGGATSGFSGKSLLVLKIIFKVKSSGQADFIFTDGAVTASDGSGTNVLTAMRGSRIIIAPKIETPSPSPLVSPSPLISPPAISPTLVPSPTVTPIIISAPVQITRPPVPAKKLPQEPELEIVLYPDPQKWHNISSYFLVKWELPPDISILATAVNQDPSFSPVKSEGLFDSKIFPAIDDGIWYLHIRFKNNVGWGPTAHYRLAIDTAPPLPFEITVNEGLSTDNPAPTVNFQTSDSLSGLEYYSVRIGNGDAIITGETSFVLPIQAPGKHLVRVGARDKAGNGTETSVDLEILPIVSPRITSISKDIFTGEGALTAEGTALPGIEVLITVKNQSGKFICLTVVRSDVNGNWFVKIDHPLNKGNYFFEAISRDSRGALSLPVQSDLFRARERPLLTIRGVEITQFWFFAALITILAAVFAAGWNAGRLAKEQRGRKILISQRDVAAVCGVIKSDLDKILKNYSDKKIDEREAEEMEFLLKRTRENLEKMQKYLTESIKEINN